MTTSNVAPGGTEAALPRRPPVAAIASIAPVCGFMTTIEPDRPTNAWRALRCTAGSIVDGTWWLRPRAGRA